MLNSLTLLLSVCGLRRFKVSTIGTLMKREKTLKLSRISFGFSLVRSVSLQNSRMARENHASH
jgi:hypothetical protein